MSKSDKKEEIPQEKPDLNKIIADLNVMSQVSSNLAVALAFYAKERGELDEKQFKLVSEEE